MMSVVRTSLLAIGGSILGLVATLSGCGAASPSYQVTIVATMPSTPRPINITWRGVLRPQTRTWQHLSEQIGRSPVMTLIPSPRSSQPGASAGSAQILMQESLLWNHAVWQWPRQFLPLTSVTLHQTLTGSGRLAFWTRTWHIPVQLSRAIVVPATEKLTAQVADPQHTLRAAQWTLVITSQPVTVKPRKGASYRVPELVWTERGVLHETSTF